jgi:FkbM family methyltransferase
LYNLNHLEIIFIDPTQRAFNHFSEITSNLGQFKLFDYDLSGKQKIYSYDLSRVRLDQLHFIKKALFDKDNESITLFAPSNKNFVSYSVSNFSKNKLEDKSINVKTITVANIVKNFNINENQTILKLDIEGSESQVINSIFDNNFFPRILIVEIDELYEAFFRNYCFSRRLIKKIKKANYKFIGSVNAFDYCFERNL